MFEKSKAKEAVKSVEATAAEDIIAGLYNLREVVSSNASDEEIDKARDAVFSRLAAAIEDIQKEGMIKGNTWPRSGDDSGHMDMDRFKPRQ